MTTTEIRRALWHLPNGLSELHGITVLRTPRGWSVNGQGVVGLDAATRVYETLRRLRA